MWRIILLGKLPDGIGLLKEMISIQELLTVQVFTKYPKLLMVVPAIQENHMAGKKETNSMELHKLFLTESRIYYE